MSFISGFLIAFVLSTIPLAVFGLSLIFLATLFGSFLLLTRIHGIYETGLLVSYQNWYHSFPFGCVMGTCFAIGFLYSITFVFIVTRGQKEQS